MDPPPDPLPKNKREGEAAVRCLQPNRRLTMRSHENHVATIVSLASCDSKPGRKRTGHGGKTRTAAPRANGPAGSKGAANCAAGKIRKGRPCVAEKAAW